MNKSEARRVMVAAFTKTAAEPVSTVPGVAQVKRTPHKAPRAVEGPAPKAGPAKGMIPPMQLKTTAPTSLNVTAAQISEALEKLSTCKYRSGSMSKKPAKKTKSKSSAALDQIIEKMSHCGMMRKSAIAPLIKDEKEEKAAGIHVATRDAKSKATQKPTKPGVEKLESASDEKPKKAPEKKPEPKTSENEGEEKSALVRGLNPKFFGTTLTRLLGAAKKSLRSAKAKGPAGKSVLKAKAPKARRKPRARKPAAPAAAPAAAAAAGKVGPARLAGEIGPKLQQQVSNYWPYIGALGAGAGGVAGGYGLGKLLGAAQGEPAPTYMPSGVPDAMAGIEQPGFGDQALSFLGRVGGGGMRGIGSLLGDIGLPGAEEKLHGWAEDPTIRRLVGGGGLTLGTILAIALIRRLLGGGSEA